MQNGTRYKIGDKVAMSHPGNIFGASSVVYTGFNIVKSRRMFSETHHLLEPMEISFITQEDSSSGRKMRFSIGTIKKVNGSWAVKNPKAEDIMVGLRGKLLKRTEIAESKLNPYAENPRMSDKDWVRERFGSSEIYDKAIFNNVDKVKKPRICKELREILEKDGFGHE